MTDYSTQHCTTLEVFPDELFFEIFEYIPLNDLYRAFFGLNRRFNIILKSLSNLFAEWTTRADDRVIGVFSSCITRLVVWRGGHLNLHRFERLRSLKLALPTIEQCNEIQPSSRLEHLHIETSGISSRITDQISILFLKNAFPNLRTCRIDEVQFDGNIVCPKQVLYSLSTRTRHPARIFPMCPKLTHLRMNLTSNINEFSSSELHVNLRRLEIGIYSTEVNLIAIESILSLTPNLTRFTLDGPCNPPPQNQLDLPSLASVLSRFLLKLRSIHISLPLTDSQSDSKEFENEKEMLKRLHPLFYYVSYRSRSYYAPGRLIISSMNHRSNNESIVS